MEAGQFRNRRLTVQEVVERVETKKKASRKGEKDTCEVPTFSEQFGLVNAYYVFASSIPFSIITFILGAYRMAYTLLISLEPPSFTYTERSFYCVIPLALIVTQIFFVTNVRRHRKTADVKAAEPPPAHRSSPLGERYQVEHAIEREGPFKKYDLRVALIKAAFDAHSRPSLLQHLDFVVEEMGRELNRLFAKSSGVVQRRGSVITSVKGDNASSAVGRLSIVIRRRAKKILVCMFCLYTLVFGFILGRYWYEELHSRPSGSNSTLFSSMLGHYHYSPNASIVSVAFDHTLYVNTAGSRVARIYLLSGLFGVVEGFEIMVLFGHITSSLLLLWITASVHRLRLKLMRVRLASMKEIPGEVGEAVDGSDESTLEKFHMFAVSIRQRFFHDYLVLKKALVEASSLWSVYIAVVVIVALATGIVCLYIIFAGNASPPPPPPSGSNSSSSASDKFADILVSNVGSTAVGGGAALLIVVLLVVVVVFMNEGVRSMETQVIASKPSDFIVLGGRDKVLDYVMSNPIQFSMFGFRVDKRFVVGFIAAGMSTFTIAAIVANLQGPGGN